MLWFFSSHCFISLTTSLRPKWYLSGVIGKCWRLCSRLPEWKISKPLSMLKENITFDLFLRFLQTWCVSAFFSLITLYIWGTKKIPAGSSPSQLIYSMPRSNHNTWEVILKTWPWFIFISHLINLHRFAGSYTLNYDFKLRVSCLLLLGCLFFWIKIFLRMVAAMLGMLGCPLTRAPLEAMCFSGAGYHVTSKWESSDQTESQRAEMMHLRARKWMVTRLPTHKSSYCIRQSLLGTQQSVNDIVWRLFKVTQPNINLPFSMFHMCISMYLWGNGTDQWRGPQSFPPRICDTGIILES